MINVVYLQMDSRNFCKELLRKGIAGRQVAEGSWAVLAKVEPKPAGSQGKKAGKKEKPMTTKAQTWMDLEVTKRIISVHRKDKIEDIKRFGGPKGHRFWGVTQAISIFSLNIGKLELRGAFFPWKN